MKGFWTFEGRAFDNKLLATDHPAVQDYHPQATEAENSRGHWIDSSAPLG